MIGQLLLLDTGVTVFIADSRGGGWWRAVIIHSRNPDYPAFGPDIQISERDVEAARTLQMTDGIVDMMAWNVPVNGPAPTVDTFIANVNAAVTAAAA